MIKKGDYFNEYLITGYIDKGGMGSIWSVKKDHTEYALKVCEKTDEESLKRFKREYRLMQHLNHPQIRNYAPI